MHKILLLCSLVSAFSLSSHDQAHAAPSTASFMNTMTVCGAGSSIKIDSNLEGSIISVYERESTRGKLTQDIIPEIAKLLPKSNTYELYLDCIKKILPNN